MAKSGFVFYNYTAGEVVAMPDDFRAKFPRVNWLDCTPNILGTYFNALLRLACGGRTCS
jgi:hypothetical protein